MGEICFKCKKTVPPKYEWLSEPGGEGYGTIISWVCDNCGNSMCESEITDPSFIFAANNLAEKLAEGDSE